MATEVQLLHQFQVSGPLQFFPPSSTSTFHTIHLPSSRPPHQIIRKSTRLPISINSARKCSPVLPPAHYFWIESPLWIDFYVDRLHIHFRHLCCPRNAGWSCNYAVGSRVRDSALLFYTVFHFPQQRLFCVCARWQIEWSEQRTSNNNKNSEEGVRESSTVRECKICKSNSQCCRLSDDAVFVVMLRKVVLFNLHILVGKCAARKRIWEGSRERKSVCLHQETHSFHSIYNGNWANSVEETVGVDARFAVEGYWIGSLVGISFMWSRCKKKKCASKLSENSATTKR